MDTSGVRVLATFRMKEGKLDEMLKALRTLVNGVCKEAGCIEYDCFVDTKDPLLFTFIEHWTSEEDLKAHSAGDPVKRWSAMAPELREPGTEIRILKSVWE